MEIGWKYRPLGPVALNAAVFAMKKRDVILREANGFNVGNGATRHRGFEYEVRSVEGHWPVQFRAAGTIARHEYAFTRAIEGGESITAGNEADTAPRHVHSLELGVPFGDDDAWMASLDLNYVGSYYLDAANTARYPGHRVANLRFSWTTPSLLHLTLRVDNLFDTDYADRADFAFGDYRYFPARGRAAFLSVDYSSN